VGYCVRARVDFVPALLAVVLGLCCVTGSLLARPHVLALPLLAVWTAELVSAREQHRAPRFWLLPVITLWANLHGSFAFGIALSGAMALEALAENRNKVALQWGIFVAAALVCAMITPFGLEGLLFPVKLSAMTGLGQIGEWQPTDFSSLSPFAIALLATFFVLGRGEISIPPIRLSIVLSLVWLALSHGRHQMLLGVCAPLLLAPSLGKKWPATNARARRWGMAVAASGFAILIVARLILPITRSDDLMTPATALAHVPEFVRQLPVLNDYAYGGYLIFNGVKPFIDSRADLYGDTFLQNYARLVAPDKDDLTADLEHYHIHWTIFPTNSNVVKLLDATPGWHRYYSDKIATVHIRADASLGRVLTAD